MGEAAEPNGTVGYRLSSIERRIDKIELLEPAVMRQELRDVKDDIRDIRKDVTWVKRAFVGFCITFAFSGISMVLLIVTSRHP